MDVIRTPVTIFMSMNSKILVILQYEMRIVEHFCSPSLHGCRMGNKRSERNISLEFPRILQNRLVTYFIIYLSYT